MGMYEDISEIPQIKRGLVWCRTCGRCESVKGAEATMGGGWPECCGYTMTIDSPEEREAMENPDGC